MNKLLLLLLSLIVCFGVNMGALAQKSNQNYVKTIQDTEKYEKIRFGVKLGGQISAVNEIHRGSNKRVPALTIGATMLMPLQKKETCRIFFAPELLYSQGGEKGQANDGSQDVKFYFDYIDLPLLIKGYFMNNKRLFIEFGPKLSYMINHKNEDKDLFESNKFDFGLCLGGGVSLGSYNNFEIGARLNYGLTDIYPDTKSNNNNISGAVIFTYIF